ncbi:MAG: hypothetical protein JW720_09915 [Sedimentisphaerales bacterium]|nr:hypothetical protein [Sedimentisphaerales bacterium]
MPIVDGQYQEQISTVFKTTAEAVEQIKAKIAKSRRLRISCIPATLLKKLMPLLKGKDVKVILPGGEKPPAELKDICEVAVQKAKIYSDFKGVEASEGAIYFAEVMYCVTWSKTKILQVSAMHYAKCVKCMKGTFEMAWRYSDKLK